MIDRALRLSDVSEIIALAGRKVSKKFSLPRFKKPVLTVIVPVYNVEKYLETCVKSLLGQSLKEVTILLINDGSTDQSLEIAKRLAKRDPRVQLFDQPNAGLGAVRNRGLELATTKYVTFVDSDDTIPKAAYESMVAALESSGSDFVVGKIYRRKGQTDIFPKWSQELHSKNRIGIKVEEYPEILRDFYSPNKVYKTALWKENNFRFREGVLFEDQPLISELYATAKTIDILAEPTYCWFIREDDSSLSGNLYETHKVEARVQAVQLTREFFASVNRPVLQTAWLQTLVDGHFPNYIRSAVRGPKEQIEATISLVRAATSLDELDALLGVSPFNRDLVRSFHLGNISHASLMLALGNQNPKWVPRSSGASAITFTPKNKISGQDFEPVIWERKHLPVESGITRFFFNETDLVVEGWTARLFDDPENLSSTDLLMSLRNSVNETAIFGEVAKVANPHADRHLGDHYTSYSDAGWKVEFPLNELQEAWSGGTETWEFCVEVQSLGLAKEMRNFARQTLALNADYSFTGLSTNAVVSANWVENDRLILEIHGRATTVSQVGSDQDTGEIRVEIESHGLDPLLKAVRQDGKQRPLRRTGRTNFRNYEVRLSPKPSKSLRIDRFSRISTNLYKGPATTPKLRASCDPGLAYTENGEAFVVNAHQALEITQIGMDDSGGFSVEVNCTHLETLYLLGVTSKREIFGQREGNFWKFGKDDLLDEKEGALHESYILKGTLELGHVRNEISTLEMGPFAELPLEFWDGELGLRLEVDRRGLVVRTIPKTWSYGYSPFQFQRYIEKANKPFVDSQKALFQCLDGVSPSDSQLSIARELRNRFPEMTITWGVKNPWMRVPEGDKRVVVRTEGWVKAWQESGFICVNHEVPTWFERQDGQRVLQTYHGHPFKMMGLARWQQQKQSPFEIERLLAERAAWTHLLSPSNCASSLYKENIPLDYTLLELGHPRNDDLLKSSAELRSRAINDLDLDPDLKYVLYAPTWRDYSASSPWRSSIPKFLNPAELIDLLGPEYVLLMRGHHSHFDAASTVRGAERVIDVTKYPEINDLIALADFGVFDYSSIRFDFGLTRKPMIFFVPDLEEYFEFSPGLLPFEDTIVGPKVQTTGEVAEAIQLFANEPSLHSQEREIFASKFGEWDDGNAGARVVEALFPSGRAKNS